MDDNQPRDLTEPNKAAAAAGSDPGRNIGVYLLDAATPAERVEFGRAIGAAPDVRAEAVQLASVAVAMGAMYDLSPEQAPEVFAGGVDVSPELRQRVLDSAAASSAAVVEEPAPEPMSISSAQAMRPQGRVLGGAPAAAGEPTPIRDRGIWRSPWLAAAAMLIVAVGVSLWALGLQNKLNDQTRELHAQSTEVAQVRADSNASAFNITATSDGVANSGGTLFYSMKDQKTVLTLNNLAPVANTTVYQLWYIKGKSAPAPGVTFKPNQDGSALLTTQAPITSFDVVALTKEPAGGSLAPTTPILLVGAKSAAAG